MRLNLNNLHLSACELLAGAGKAENSQNGYPHVHLGDLKDAQRLTLEDILTVQESGTAWAVSARV